MKQVFWFSICCTLCCSTLFGCTRANQSSAAAQPERTSQPNQNVSVAQQTPEPTPIPLSEKDVKKRKEVHKMLLAGRYAHDGALTLSEIGDVSSVPPLLAALKANPPNENGGMICTTAHILAALKKITNHDAGIRYEQWAAWWEEYRKEKNLDDAGQPNNGMHPTRDTLPVKLH